MEMTLTVGEIHTLAKLAGITVGELDATIDGEVEITVSDEIERIVGDGSEPDEKYSHVAFFQEYPEDGFCGLGEPLELLTKEST